MVAALPTPRRPLKGGVAWTWSWRAPSRTGPWEWCRIYHISQHAPDGVTHRVYGPLARLDPHTPPPEAPTIDPDGRSVLYVGRNLVTSLGEVFGDFPEAQICPQMRVALVRPTSSIMVLDLRSQGAAMKIGALPSIAVGDYPRARTQEWARAIYEDQPVHGRQVDGVYYTAAHSGGASLALWKTEGQVEVVTNRDGVVQDLALAESPIWPRAQVRLTQLGLRSSLVAGCPHCLV